MKSRVVLLALCATLCVVTGHAESEMRTLASVDTKNLADTSGFRPSFGIMGVSGNDEPVGACSQYWRLTNTFIQCNMIPRDHCYGNPLIRYDWDASGSC